jgi:hypothetical protein
LNARLAADGEPVAPEATNPAEPTEEEGAPAGPSEAEETALFAAQKLQAAATDTMTAGLGLVAEVEEAATKLPAMEELVRRIPAGAREVMDELFRAKFVRVQRVPKQALHP